MLTKTEITPRLRVEVAVLGVPGTFDGPAGRRSGLQAPGGVRLAHAARDRGTSAAIR